MRNLDSFRCWWCTLCPSKVREISFLLTFETAPFFCVYPVFIYKVIILSDQYHLYSSTSIGGATMAVGYITSKPTASTKQYSSDNIVNLYFALTLHYKWWMNCIQNSSLQREEKKPCKRPRYRWEDNIEVGCKDHCLIMNVTPCSMEKFAAVSVLQNIDKFIPD